MERKIRKSSKPGKCLEVGDVVYDKRRKKALKVAKVEHAKTGETFGWKSSLQESMGEFFTGLSKVVNAQFERARTHRKILRYARKLTNDPQLTVVLFSGAPVVLDNRFPANAGNTIRRVK
jgi:hypothetical protein